MDNVHWPAEWQQQQAVWFSWPHRADTWQGDILELQRKFAGIISTCARYQKVCINADKSLFRSIESMLPSMVNVELFDHPTNDVWCRDHGATFVVENNSLKAIDWQFNAWGEKFQPWDLDDQIAQQMATATQAKYYRSPLYLEGGAIEGNGAGIVITTEAVALNRNRNPDWSKQEVETELKKCLGATDIFWLPKGIEGDDTDGHIDDLTRFIQEDAVITIIESNTKDKNYRTLQENYERLQDLKTTGGSNIEIIKLPMPDPIVAKNWRLETLPASYANFLILNEAVLVPTFNQANNDDRALGVIRECFADREVTGIDCRNIVFEGGAIHCISQQQPVV